MVAQYGTGGSSAFGSQMSYGSNYSNDDASYGATAPGVIARRRRCCESKQRSGKRE